MTLCIVAGYIRVLMNVLAFAICFSNKKIFSALYFIRLALPVNFNEFTLRASCLILDSNGSVVYAFLVLCVMG